jgi:hypothetical protein
MTHTELSPSCRLTFAVVGDWLNQQDETTRLIHRAVVETIQMSSEAPLDYVLHEIHRDYPDEYPDEWLPYDKGALPILVNEFLNREFQDLSDLFTRFYREFNVRFFAGSLPGYVVKVFHNFPLPIPITPSNVCRNQMRTGWLAFTYNGWPDSMIEDLLHKMAHISTDSDHGLAWQREMERIRQMGAPVRRDEEGPRLMEWNPVSPSPRRLY